MATIREIHNAAMDLIEDGIAFASEDDSDAAIQSHEGALSRLHIICERLTATQNETNTDVELTLSIIKREIAFVEAQLKEVKRKRD